MISREHYEAFARNCPSLPLFLQPWWLDAASGDGNWVPVVVLHEGVPVGVWPVPLRKKGPFTVAGMLHLTDYLGPWMPSLSIPLVEELKESFPKYDVFCQNILPGLEFLFLPGQKGWEIKERHTRCILDLKEWNETQMLPRARASLKKAKANLQVCETQDSDRVWVLLKMSFERQNLAVPFPEAVYRSLFQAGESRGCLRAWVAFDPVSRRDCSTVAIFNDQSTAYYLLGGNDPDLRNMNGSSLVLFHAIVEMQRTMERFDFLGSMIPSVDSFFESLGGKRATVLEVSHLRSPLLRVAKFIGVA